LGVGGGGRAVKEEETVMEPGRYEVAEGCRRCAGWRISIDGDIPKSMLEFEKFLTADRRRGREGEGDQRRVVRWWGHCFSSGWNAGGAEGDDLLMKEEGR
jgi:hypothetical protein